VAGDVDLDIDQVSVNVHRLMQLHDVVEQLERRVARLRERQSTDVWPHVSGITEFASRYRDAIRNAEQALVGVRAQLEQARQALADSARSHQLQDAAVQERLVALAARLDGSAPDPAPTVGGRRRAAQ